MTPWLSVNTRQSSTAVCQPAYVTPFKPAGPPDWLAEYFPVISHSRYTDVSMYWLCRDALAPSSRETVQTEILPIFEVQRLPNGWEGDDTAA
jgi:hypothetical protein